GRDRPRHEHREETRPEAELLIERHMLDALREGEKADMARAQRLQSIDDRGDELSRNALVPQIGMYGQRPEISDASPRRAEARSDEPPVEFRRERACRRFLPARTAPFAVGPERG